MNPDGTPTRIRALSDGHPTAAAPTPAMRQCPATRFAAVVAIPNLLGERCVHARIETASCRACAEACPRGAWVIDEKRVGIDTGACDGCDLCVPACPEGAITSDRQRASDIMLWRDQPSVFRSCEYAGVPDQTGLIPCLHAIGPNELLRLYRRGATGWITSAAPCETCPRGRTQRLQDSIRQVNALLISRSLQPLSLTVLKPDAWSDSLRWATPYQAEAVLTRRRFFRKALELAVDTASEATADAAVPEAKFIAATTGLPATGANDVYLYQPRIDPQQCNGCDACVRLCPHQAILLERLAESWRYRLVAEQCTGCGICRDACDQHAVSLDSLQTRQAPTVDLIAGRCTACGAPYHAPATNPITAGRCRICTRTRHTRLLYQVLE